jgi:hypothetical protein
VFPRSSRITLHAAMRDLSASADPRVRAACADALGHLPATEARDRAVTALLAALDDVDPDVRATASLSLGHLGDARASDRLIAGLDDEVSVVRQACAIALGELGAAAAAPRLCQALRTGPPDLRFQAATSLALIDPDGAAAPLVEALADADPEVQSAAALALGALGCKGAAHALRGMLGHPVPQTRFDAAYALSAIDGAAAVPALAAFLSSSRLAWPAIEGLERAATATAAEIVAGLLAPRAATRLLRLRAAAALLAVAPDHRSAPAARATLIAALTAWRVQIRALGVEELGRVAGPWALPALHSLARARAGRRLQDEIADAVAAIEARAATTGQE